MTAVVQTRALTKRFALSIAIDNVTLEIAQGAIFAVIGANGAGKSTLLRLLAGLLWPTSGEVWLFGEPLSKEAAAVRQRLQYIGGEEGPFRSFRVSELVYYSSLLYERWDGERCHKLLRALELPENRSIRQLSTGTKMQLRLAIALSSHPDLLVLDEPTNGLDPVVKRQFLQLIVQEAAASGTSVVLATHLLEDVARLADGMAVMYKGRVIACGQVDDLRGSVRRLQAALPGGLPPHIEDHPAISRVERHGQVFTLTVERFGEDVEPLLWSAGATFVESVPLELADLFHYLMHKEGYARDALQLS